MRSRDRIEYKTNEQIIAMRSAGLAVAALHRALVDAVRPGITTGELDEIAGETLARHGVRSNFLGYYDFPGHTCISVDEEIVHGIPGKRRIAAGAVVSFDCGAVKDGWHSDAAVTTIVGGEAAATPQAAGLVAATNRAMWAGIAATAKRGACVRDIGIAVEDVVEEHAARTGQQLGIVEEFVGHGIGSALHQPPDVPNYRTRQRGPRLRPGMTLCIEPMLTIGSPQNKTLADDWKVVTCDGSLAAHWEHCVAIHERGIWVLTSPDGGEAGLAPFGVTPVPLSD